MYDKINVIMLMRNIDGKDMFFNNELLYTSPWPRTQYVPWPRTQYVPLAQDLYVRRWDIVTL